MRVQSKKRHDLINLDKGAEPPSWWKLSKLPIRPYKQNLGEALRSSASSRISARQFDCNAESYTPGAVPIRIW